MRRTVSIAAIKLVQWSEASLLTSRFSTAEIIASWHTGLEFRRRIRCTSRESVSVSGEHRPLACIVAGSLPATFENLLRANELCISAGCRDEQAGSLCSPELCGTHRAPLQ